MEMKQFLESIIKSIVENPQSVTINESQEEGRVVFMISVDDNDMGRVIGKDGKVINAIRLIMRVMAIRQDVRIRVDLEDKGKPQESSPAQAPEPQQPQVDQPQQPTDRPAAEPTPQQIVGQPQETSTTVIDNSGTPEEETPA